MTTEITDGTVAGQIIQPRQTVWRFEVAVDDRPHTFRMSPQGAPTRIENCPGAIDRIEFWAHIQDASILTDRRFLVTGTGHPAPLDAVYCGCAGRNEAGLVWHLWELPKGPAA